ncbi:hypothetical protein, partial [[Clostridium] symbiosum]
VRARSAEQSGIKGGKRPFDPNIMTLVQPLAKRQYMMHKTAKNAVNCTGTFSWRYSGQMKEQSADADN